MIGYEKSWHKVILEGDSMKVIQALKDEKQFIVSIDIGNSVGQVDKFNDLSFFS